ncbi:adhesive plaque matrix protein 2-like [Macrosteles quadrilineatus]|uniref:adhesive plaque matrix protein 2-like n=1 Tax=Macrosteles quadrilineatus TaxID=74068 RepID=UPI0023E2DE3D|nr:adhesive plaque matrix protein 2-like [Macrosteles quadrilineatus]
MHLHPCVVITLAIVAAVVGVPGCEERPGCRIQAGQCLCGIGCPSDYIYVNKEECRTALKGRRNDVCQRSPCLNSGSCSQTSVSPGYRCRCEGTGYYGHRCQHACPKPGSIGADFHYPYECIVI